VGCCDHGHEHLCSIKCGEFFDWIKNCSLVKKDSVLGSWLVSYLAS